MSMVDRGGDVGDGWVLVDEVLGVSWQDMSRLFYK